MYRTVFWTLWEKARVGWSERIALKHIYYHTSIRSPVQVRCMSQGARGWCTGMTQRNGMRREVGGGFGWGRRVHPWWIHVKYGKNHYSIVISLRFKNKLNSFAKKGLINVGFVTSKNTIIFLLSSLLPPPSFFPFLSYYTIVKVCFPLIVITVLALFTMLYNTSLSSSYT